MFSIVQTKKPILNTQVSFYQIITMADINIPWVQYILCAHRFGLTTKAILMDLHIHYNDEITIDEIKEILSANNQLPKEIYQWYNLEYRTSNQTFPETSYPWNAWTARYAHRCQLNNMANITIWEHMLARGYELPVDTPITHILNAREFIQNHLLAVCENAIALADLYIPTVLRVHSWGYTLSEILLAIFAENVDEDDYRHLVATLSNYGVRVEMQRTGRNFCDGSPTTIIIEEFVTSAYLIRMEVDEIRDLCYAHGFSIVDGGPVKDILVRVGLMDAGVDV